ncbi:MAG TPA: ABC transporter substrate-binding protein, partial [Gammaproteobacteria bacterium]|nr:ABC transporter substrate-binding protein [Gammaproteobacteria bacterium]
VEPAQPSPSLQKLRLVLDWFINPNHATLFVAEEQGFFKEQGLEVSLLSPADSSEAPKLVAALQAELALVYEPEFIDQIEQGLPLIAIGTLIDKPLNCLLVRQDGPIQRLADLKNKKIGTSGGGIKVLMLKTMLHKQGLSLQEVELIQVHHNLMQALLAKKVDAITGAMRNIEAEQLSVLGHKPLLFFPEKNGVPPYSELIFVVNKNMLQQNKLSSLRGFLLALKKAAAYLNKHPEASWQAFVKKYPALNNESNHRAWLASLPYFTKHPERFSAEEWRAFIAFMRQNGLIKSKQHLSNYINEMTT